MEAFIAFLTENAAVLGAGGGLVAILAFVLRPIGFLRKQPKIELHEETVKQIAPKETGKLSVTEFIRIRREMKADLEEDLAAAHEDEKAQLRARIAELESDIANPDAALAEAEKTIVDLTARLERMGNEIGGDRLAEARAALERLDFSVADDIFAEVEAQQELAVQEAARAAYGRGEVAEAEVRWADAAEHYARAARLVPDYKTLRKASDFSERSGNYAGALTQSAAMLAFCKERGSQKQLSDALNEHAGNSMRAGRFQDAEKLFRDALEIDKATIGEAHPDFATRLNNLAVVLEARGDLAEAERLYRQALEIDKATIGEAHPDYASRLNNLAGVLRARGDLAEAERLYRQALEIGKATIGEAHPNYALRLNNLAVVLQARGDLAEAERLYRQSQEIDRAALGEEHPEYAKHAINLAGLLAETGRREEAGTLFEAGLKAFEAALGEGHPDTMTAREMMEAFRERKR